MVSDKDKTAIVSAVLGLSRPKLNELGGSGIGKTIGYILVIAGTIYGLGYILWPHLIY